MKTESAVQYSNIPATNILDINGFRDNKDVSVKDFNGETRYGIAASSGFAIGKAIVITKDEDFPRVKDGSIVFSRTATPKLVTIMDKAKAIITENGGLSANSMAFARIYGIPAVLGIPGLTEIIKDGDFVRIDGTKGNIEIRKSMTLHRIK